TLDENQFFHLPLCSFNREKDIQNKALGNTAQHAEYIRTIVHNNRKLEKLIYKYTNFSFISEFLPYFSNLKILSIQPSDLITEVDGVIIKSVENKILDQPNLYNTLEEMHYFPLSEEFFNVISNYKHLKKLHLDFSYIHASRKFCNESIKLKEFPTEELSLSH